MRKILLCLLVAMVILVVTPLTSTNSTSNGVALQPGQTTNGLAPTMDIAAVTQRHIEDIADNVTSPPQSQSFISTKPPAAMEVRVNVILPIDGLRNQS